MKMPAMCAGQDEDQSACDTAHVAAAARAIHMPVDLQTA
jgi:hypothetical protein